ncbi:MAG TPA: metallophosphoesterase family protein [Isosphaeraceae bacterium]|nr:metallophosphoesterase family protein [Isosphaeraceae bacterium]
MKLLILSDIHGNWPALEAVLRAEGSWDAVAFCGDVVDYGPNPVECLHWVAEHAEFRVRGNHDNALAFSVDCRCMGSFREASLVTRAWHRTLLDPADLALLRDWPTLTWFEWQEQHFRMAHATPHGDLFEYLALNEWEQRVKDLESDFVLLGHTHIQNMCRVRRLTVVNPGSVGLNRDGTGKACYAVHDGENMALKRVAYDVDRTVAALRSSPLPRHVVCKLEFSLRPKVLEDPLSENILT